MHNYNERFGKCQIFVAAYRFVNLDSIALKVEQIDMKKQFMFLDPARDLLYKSLWGSPNEKSHNIFTIPRLSLYIHLLYFRLEKIVSIDGKVFLT